MIAVVGTGFSGLGACMALIEKGIRPIVVDVGHEAETIESMTPEELYFGREEKNFQALKPDHSTISPLLNGPHFQHVARTAYSDANNLLVESLATGGLGNAWGAGAFVFDDRDLQGFPFQLSNVSSIYTKMKRLMNVSSSQDSLQKLFHEHEGEEHRQIAYSTWSDNLLEKYKLSPASGIILGRPRLALHPDLSRHSMDYFHNRHPLRRLFFNPATVFSDWEKQGKIQRLKSHRLLKIEKAGQKMNLYLENPEGNLNLKVERLFLATGVLPTAKIISRSLMRKLSIPLLDNPGVQIPFLLTSHRKDRQKRAGIPIPTFQITGLFPVKGSGGDWICNFMDLTFLPPDEFVRVFPLSIPLTLKLRPWIIDKMIAAYCFAPCESYQAARIEIDLTGKISVTKVREQPLWRAALQQPLANLRNYGLYTHSALWKQPRFGASLHLAGTFPYSPTPSPLETDELGCLQEFPNMHIVDGSVFPRLPAKNYSLTLATNSYRTAATALDLHKRYDQ